MIQVRGKHCQPIVIPAGIPQIVENRIPVRLGGGGVAARKVHVGELQYAEFRFPGNIEYMMIRRGQHIHTGAGIVVFFIVQKMVPLSGMDKDQLEMIVTM
jgi:hypothetical protein